eukprot:scaffold7.g3397.t1
MASLLASSSFAGQRLAFKPATQRAQQQRVISISADGKLSRIGKQPVPLPDKVQVTLDGQTVKVKGPRGELQRTLHPLVRVSQGEKQLLVERVNDSRQANALHGLSRSLVANMVTGVDAGFTRTLQMVGVGYRAAVAGSKITLSLGYSHPVEMDIPKGLEAKVEKNTTIFITGSDKELVGQFAADIRSKRRPEPYKGKGVRYSDEVVRRKEGKRGK